MNRSFVYDLIVVHKTGLYSNEILILSSQLITLLVVASVNISQQPVYPAANSHSEIVLRLAFDCGQAPLN
jgi:hypothetical protein